MLRAAWVPNPEQRQQPPHIRSFRANRLVAGPQQHLLAFRNLKTDGHHLEPTANVRQKWAGNLAIGHIRKRHVIGVARIQPARALRPGQRSDSQQQDRY